MPTDHHWHSRPPGPNTGQADRLAFSLDVQMAVLEQSRPFTDESIDTALDIQALIWRRTRAEWCAIWEFMDKTRRV